MVNRITSEIKKKFGMEGVTYTCDKQSEKKAIK